MTTMPAIFQTGVFVHTHENRTENGYVFHPPPLYKEMKSMLSYSTISQEKVSAGNSTGTYRYICLIF